MRALVYLACSQQADGGFPQNFWIDGSPYWQGIQLDEVAFPILLAWHLWKEDALKDFDPYPMIRPRRLTLSATGRPHSRSDGKRDTEFPIYAGGHHCGVDLCCRFRRARGKHNVASFLQDTPIFLSPTSRAGRLRPRVPRSWNSTPLHSYSSRGDRRSFGPMRIPITDSSPFTIVLPGSLAVPGERHRGCGFPRVGPLRHSQARRSTCRRLLASGGCCLEGGYPFWPLLAPLQP